MKRYLAVIALLATAAVADITTRPPAGKQASGGCSAPVAAFSADDTTPDTATAVVFTDESTVGAAPCDAAVTDWLWDFGDLETSTAQNPSHTYTVADTYSVSLRVRSLLGEGNLTKAGYIVVSEAP
jgi:PKD repeat protein